jgi:hypothetical protein
VLKEVTLYTNEEVTLYTNEKLTENLQLHPALGYAETGRRTDEGFEASLLQQAPRGIDWYETRARDGNRTGRPVEKIRLRCGDRLR